ncbi:MAG TPA: DUF481 domain-containing protein [Candidatus Polarisedimenticolia bacterium]
MKLMSSPALAVRSWRRALFLGVLALAGAIPAFAQQDPNERWKDSAEMSYVVTAGNSDTQTFGFKNKLWRAWDKNALEFNLGGVRAKATTRRFAIADDPNDPQRSFDIEEERDLVAEAYYFNGRYDRKLSDRFFWYAGAGWERNRFAGLQNRYTAAGGVGNLWFDTERAKWRTDYSATYTRQDDVVVDPGFDDTFFGVRVTSSFMKKMGASTTYTNDTILDENVDETKDFRANMINGLSVQMSTHLALKVSLQSLYDNRPAIRELETFFDDPVRGLVETKKPVIDELDRLDTIFTTSLVINF